MELLLTLLVWLWQIGWVLLLGGGMCALVLWLICPLRKRKKLTLAACVLAVCLLLTALCVHPVVRYDGSAEDTEQIRQLAAGPYSNRIPVIPVCAVAEEMSGGTQVQVWYAFVGSMTYIKDGDGVWSITEWLFPWI